MSDGSFEPDLESWDPWQPAEVAHHLDGVDAEWYVAAGWALDLFQERQTRAHEDIEIGVPSTQFPAIREALAGFDLVVVGGGRAWPLTPSALARHHQTWVRDSANDSWRLDVLREPWDGDHWVFRRQPRIRLARDRFISSTKDGIPYAVPETVLLFKAAATRAKDEQDFAAVSPLLDDDQRMWLAEALALVSPRHRWLRELRS